MSELEPIFQLQEDYSKLQQDYLVLQIKYNDLLTKCLEYQDREIEELQARINGARGIR